MTNRTSPRTDRGWLTLAAGAITTVMIAGAIITAIALHSSTPPPVRYDDATTVFVARCQDRTGGTIHWMEHKPGSFFYQATLDGSDGTLYSCLASQPHPHSLTLTMKVSSL